MSRVRERRRMVLPTGAFLLLLAAPCAGAGVPKGYCPIPEPGEPPSCLEPVRERYGDLLGEIERGEVDEDEAARLEAALSDEDGRYEALSLLAYAYYALSRRAATAPHQDPAVARRLERFNALLRAAYQRHPPGDPFRASVEQAVQDIARRAPPVVVRCRDARGRERPCTSTEALLHGLRDFQERTGIRGALARLLARMLGREPR